MARCVGVVGLGHAVGDAVTDLQQLFEGQIAVGQAQSQVRCQALDLLRMRFQHMLGFGKVHRTLLFRKGISAAYR
ncbi:hypothetical protein [Cyclobacterium roseum]|uniref:hypothetical protein n=1 Tax=Cyclobacterium roseum TaxID=2666137 RepID=UPI0013909B60|nr:hypothetical protein [Cyclobacterium roseum]